MAFIRTAAPSTLTLYTTHQLSPPTISLLQRDFELAAFPRHPSVLLSISPRTDFYGLTAEAVLERVISERRKESEQNEEAVQETGLEDGKGFMVADDLTERDGDGLWYIEGWLQKDDIFEGALDPKVEKDVKYDEEGNSNIAEKVRIFMHQAPILHVNLEIANTAIPESWNYPYDPNSPLTLIPQDGGADWRFMSPPSAYIIAGPALYETKSNAEIGDGSMLLGASKKQNDEMKMYRLNELWAEKLGVVPSWSSGWEWDGRTKDKEELNLAEENGLLSEGKPTEGVVVFAQSWKWEEPDLPKKLTEDWKGKYMKTEEVPLHSEL